MDSEAYGTHLLLENTCETVIVLNKQLRVHAPEGTESGRRFDKMNISPGYMNL